jgi:class 3 adenylate cyclase/tetratricopeptide (TPR) repeat protein
VFLDLSGFTAMTRAFGQAGPEGAERLTALVNRYFALAADEIHTRGGDILKFAGDAVWAYFPFPVYLQDIFHKISLGVQSLDGSLQIHGGAEFGSFQLMTAGDSTSRLEIEPVGDLITSVARLADQAGSGNLLVGENLAGQLPVREHSRCVNDDHATPDERIRAYLSPELLSRLESAIVADGLDYEHRDVAVLFAHLQCQNGISNDHRSIQLQRRLSQVFGIISGHKGNIARLDPYGQGHKLLALFGAPVQHQDDHLHALQAARDLLTVADSGFSIRVGLSSGPLFCGEAGTVTRREYTVMGEPVNLAARLMGCAEDGQILFDSAARKHLPAEIVSTPLTVEAKGYSDPVRAHVFTKLEEIPNNHDRQCALVGRSNELSRLDSIVTACARGAGKVIQIRGSVGVGKTALLKRFAAERAESSIYLDCRPSLLFGSGWVAREILERLLAHSPFAATCSIEKLLSEQVEHKWLPLLSPLVGEPVDENEWTFGLAPELRLRKTAEIYAQLIEHLCSRTGAVLLDNIDRADEYSRDLAYGLGETIESTPLLLVLSSRSTSGSVPDSDQPGIETITLGCPNDSDWWQYFTENFRDGKLEHELFEALLEKSVGNPLIITQYLDHSLNSGALHCSEVSGKLECSTETEPIPLPSSIREISLHKFDSLPELDRAMLKDAAVCGGPFDVGLLQEVCQTVRSNELKNRLRTLLDTGILSYDRISGRYDFAHASMREAIYSCLPSSNREDCHRRFFHSMQARSDTVLSTLAHHAFYGAQWKESFSISLAAAKLARSIHSLSEAGSLFRQCEISLSKLSLDEVPNSHLFDFQRTYARHAEFTGDMGKAFALNRRRRHTASRSGDVGEYCAAVAETAHLFWIQSKYRQCERILTLALSETSLGEYPDVKARLLSIRAEIHRRHGDFDLARDYAREAATAVAGSADESLKASVYNKLGLALWGGGALEEAVDAYERSLSLGHESKFAQAQASNNLAIIYWEQGNLIKAERLMNEALQVFKDIGDRRNESYASGNLASLYRLFGNYNKGLDLLREADAVFVRTGDEHAHNYVLGNIADIELIVGDLDSARTKFESVAAFAKSVDDKELSAECEVRFGELAFYSGQNEEAYERYHQAIATSEAIGSKEYLIRASIGLARLLVGKKDSSELRKTIEQVRNTASETKAVMPLHEVSFLEAEWYRIGGNISEAVGRYKTALTYAHEQKLFELTLKCAVRLLELSPESGLTAMRLLAQLAADFEADNGEGSWSRLIESPYFVFFARTLLKTSSRPVSTDPHCLWE